MSEDQQRNGRETEESIEPAAGRAGTALGAEEPRRIIAPSSAATSNGEFDEEYQSDDDYDDDEARDGVVQFRKPAFAVLATLLGLALLALLAANVFQFVRNRNDQVVASVNGSPITQRDFNRADSSSDQTLDRLVAEKLINQEARREKVSVPNSDIDSQIGDIKKQLGSEQEFRSALQRNNLTESELRDSIRTQLLAQKMGAKGVTVSDEEAQAFYNQNKAQFPQQTFDQAKDQVKSQLLQQKQSEAVQTWIDGLRQKAKIAKHLPV